VLQFSWELQENKIRETKRFNCGRKLRDRDKCCHGRCRERACRTWDLGLKRRRGKVATKRRRCNMRPSLPSFLPQLSTPHYHFTFSQLSKFKLMRTTIYTVKK